MDSLIKSTRWDGSHELRGRWIQPANCPDAGRGVVMAFRLEIEAARECALPICLTADQRFRLFLNGEWIADGPERGDLNHWFWRNVELRLRKGGNLLVAWVWWLGEKDFPSYSQVTLSPAFWLVARRESDSVRVDTGLAPWQGKLLRGITWTDPEMCWGPGGKWHVDTRELSSCDHEGTGNGWEPVKTLEDPVSDATANNYSRTRKLRPPALPPMRREEFRAGTIRAIQKVTTSQTRDIPVTPAEPAQMALVQKVFLSEGESFTFPAGGRWRIIVDLEDYICAFPVLKVSGGRDAVLRMSWAESLFDEPRDEAALKNHRDKWQGRYFCGVGDTFICDGVERTHTTLWWECGRWIELYVETLSAPLTLEGVSFLRTRYPWDEDCEVKGGDERLPRLVEMARRTLDNCRHETFLDCPYYEQLMYFPDTRLQILCGYVTGRDDRPARKAMEMFIASQAICGAVGGSRHPTRVAQMIPSLAPVFVEMAHEYMMWRSDASFVRSTLPAIRSLLEGMLGWVNADGLLQIARGWNFFDWVDEWTYGVPPGAEYGVSAPVNWYFITALGKAAKIEEAVGDSDLAARFRRLAARMAEAVRQSFWSPERGLFADDMHKTSFSQHAQCHALLSGQLTPEESRLIGSSLLAGAHLHQCTLYQSHFLFEALAQLSMEEELRKSLETWHGFAAKGLKTFPEKEDPSRSDCHAWSAHPLYHIFATCCGIRPAEPFFRAVEFRPRPVIAGRINVRMPHPHGQIVLNWEGDHPDLSLPEGIGLVKG
ncbi:hypothetical protein QPK87_22840 [Kamptonema cortianum]|nr:hypothetical protein [Kamptonema cortianum]MDL5050417.1 hypothetical protein [Oscillatoria amoena NRMC-F 0135]